MPLTNKERQKRLRQSIAEVSELEYTLDELRARVIVENEKRGITVKFLDLTKPRRDEPSSQLDANERRAFVRKARIEYKRRLRPWLESEIQAVKTTLKIFDDATQSLIEMVHNKKMSHVQYTVTPSGGEFRRYEPGGPDYQVISPEDIKEVDTVVFHNIHLNDHARDFKLPERIYALIFQKCHVPMTSKCYPNFVAQMVLDECVIVDSGTDDTPIRYDRVKFTTHTRAAQLRKPNIQSIEDVTFVNYAYIEIDTAYELIKRVLPKNTRRIQMEYSWACLQDDFFKEPEHKEQYYTRSMIDRYNECQFYILQNFTPSIKVRFLVDENRSLLESREIELKCASMGIYPPKRFQIGTVYLLPV